MKAAFTLAILFFCAHAMAAGSQDAAPVPQCSREELKGYAAPPEATAAHRQFALPFIAYPAQSQMAGDWDWHLTLMIDPDGHVACYANRDKDGKAYRLNAPRQKIIQELGNWHYLPFEKDGTPAAAIVSESIDEWRVPEHHTPMPEVPMEQVHITLERTACFGACPTYRVELSGNGQVTYVGGDIVDVDGTHNFNVSVRDLEAMLRSIRERDIWSIPYENTMVQDAPGCELTLTMGGESHRIQCGYSAAGYAPAYADLLKQLEGMAKTTGWISLSKETISQLQAENFDFHSAAAGKILFRAIVHRSTRDEQAMLQLIQLGAPLDEDDGNGAVFEYVGMSVIDTALIRRRSNLIEPLIAAGALDTNGVRDQAKIDSAFVAAILGGDLDLIKKIWKIAGSTPHPSLTADGKSVARFVTAPHGDRDRPWQGYAIVRWLAFVGCDLHGENARGETLLQIAERAEDARLVRFLREAGLDAPTQSIRH